jgi:hypothetical protein
MNQSNSKKLASILIALVFTTGISVVGFADEGFGFTDSKSAKDWHISGQMERKKAIARGEKTIPFQAAMSGLGGVVAGITNAIMRADRQAIIELSKQFFDHPPLQKKSRKIFFPTKEDDLESKAYGLEAHYWGNRLANHAKDPNIEMNILLSDFSSMLGRCMRCHDRFRDTPAGRKIRDERLTSQK